MKARFKNKGRRNMADAGTVRDFLAHHAAQTFVGRSKELVFLSNALETSMPPVSFVHGIAGIGKSRLLEAFTAQARARKAFVLFVDCRQFEPAPFGFLRQLGSVGIFRLPVRLTSSWAKCPNAS
jgi:AAA ATPase-like protein